MSEGINIIFAQMEGEFFPLLSITTLPVMNLGDKEIYRVFQKELYNFESI
jgi:hypothetical protein